MMDCNFSRIFVMALFALALLIPGSNSHAGKLRNAAIVHGGFPGEDPALISSLSAELKAAGYQISELDAGAICDANKLTPKAFDLLVLPNAAALPAGSVQPISDYLHGGGDIIALNTPLWQRLLISADGHWTTREDYQRQNAGQLPPHVVCDFSSDSINGWTRTSNTMESPATYETIADGPAPGQRALHAVIPDLQGWDNLGVRDLQKPFPDGHTLTVFSAKGDENTTQLAVEWAEKDGSRWIAVVPLSTEWRQYVLTPKDFRFWISVEGRGGRGDSFKPANAATLSFGLAFSHTGSVGGRHEFWIGPVGTADKMPDYGQIFSAFDLPAMDTLAPSYKLFDVHEAASLSVRPDQVIVSSDKFPMKPSTEIRSPQPRPRGGGFDKRRDWRWIPLLEARSSDGQWRGTPATLMVNADGPFKGGVWASLGFGGSETYKDPAVLSLIRQVAERMNTGVFLLDGGTNFYTYFDDQDIKLGARVSNVGSKDQAGLVARVILTEAKSGKQAISQEWPLGIKAGETTSVSTSWKPQSWPEDGFIAKTDLLLDGKVIDSVTNDVRVWRPKAEKSFVTTENGDFMLDGKRWRAHGVNYMPSTGIGTEDGEYFEHWIGARSYDPEVIDRDLDRIQSMGLNAVSIFIYDGYAKDQNLLDLLRRLEDRGMHANLSLRPGTPFDFLWDKISQVIKYYRLWDNDTVFCYDLAWEPMFGTHDERKRWDGEWENWIIERYGSIINAERDWKYKVPRNEDGTITNPNPQQIDTDGEWRVMTAAYRRFLDTLLYQKYSAARRLVRGVDPNHFVSFRMAEAANPNYRWDGRIPYDFPYLAAAVDVLEPEAYGRIGDWEKVKPGWFEFEYARWAAPEKPMMWAEMGCSTWDIARMQDSQERMDFQAMFYKAFYRLLTSTGTDGVFFWWLPGGFRYGENSDFGIINPDGTDKPVTKVIRDNAKRFLDGPSSPRIDHLIEFDRDAHPDGLAGVYDSAQKEFWSAVDKGQTPGLRTAGTGSDSATCPLIAVGNTPCDGTNPPKYLDAAFDSIKIQDVDGQWVEVTKGGTLNVATGKPIYARVEFTNLGEAKLLAPVTKTSTGGVWLRCENASDPRTTPLRVDVPRLKTGVLDKVNVSLAGFTKPTEVTFTFETKGRTKFGERFKVTLNPVEWRPK